MDFLALVKRRESCRAFTGETVDAASLETIVEAMRLAPSATNQQPWRFVVVTDVSTRETMCKGMQRFTSDAGAFIVIVETGKRLTVKGMEKVKRQAWTHHDIGIAASHGTLMATELGLGSCIIGWFKERRVAEAVGMAKADRIRLILAIGVKKTNDVRVKTRKTMDEVVRWIR